MKDFKQPWHVFPYNLIELGLDYSSRDGDFEHQIAFILLDVGVEAAFKGFLMHAGQSDLDRINFYELTKRVEAELRERGEETIDFKQVLYYRDIRNKQHHKGDGVVATRKSMEGYAELAKRLLITLTGIEIGELTPYQIEKKSEELAERKKELTKRIRVNIKSMLSNSGILVEALYPSVASRTFNAQIGGIRNENPIQDVMYDDQVDVFQTQRYDQFLKLIGEQAFNDNLFAELVDVFIQFPDTFPIWIAFWELSEDFLNDWKQFLKMWAAMYPEAWMPVNWRRIVNWGHEVVNEEMAVWSRDKAYMIYNWVHTQVPDLRTDEPEIIPLIERLKDSE